MATKSSLSLARRLPVPVEFIERRIYSIRGQKVMLDASLAELYEVPTSRVNEAVKRNKERFPPDFMFQLTSDETKSLLSQFAIANGQRGGRRTLPYAFTEHGIVMLSSVLNSPRAVQMNILVVRAFVKIREILATHKDLARKIAQLDRQQRDHGQRLAAVYSVVKQLRLRQEMEEQETPKRRIGFLPSNSAEAPTALRASRKT